MRSLAAILLLVSAAACGLPAVSDGSLPPDDGVGLIDEPFRPAAIVDGSPADRPTVQPPSNDAADPATPVTETDARAPEARTPAPRRDRADGETSMRWRQPARQETPRAGDGRLTELVLLVALAALLATGSEIWSRLRAQRSR